MFIEHNYTLVTTYAAGTTSGDKTITGCTSGQPIFIVHCVTKDTSGDGEFCAIKVKSGAVNAASKGDSYILGTAGGPSVNGANSFLIIPNASSVVIYLYHNLEDEKLLVFRQ